MCCTIMQREALSEALFNVHRYEPGSQLSALWRQMCSKKLDGIFVVNLQTATRATLHQGTTKLEVALPLTLGMINYVVKLRNLSSRNLRRNYVAKTKLISRN
jgi:hypothetical protein